MSRASSKRSNWSQANTPDPFRQETQDDDTEGPPSLPAMAKTDANQDLVEQVMAILRGRHLDLYGIYTVDEQYVRSLSHAELLRIVADQ